MRRRWLVVALAVPSFAGVLTVIAGPLNPPTGAVAPTYKTLAEVEPRIAISPANTPGDADSSFRISSPGSYYLTANISGTNGKCGIEIASSGVTLDLNGFDLAGTPASLSGVHVSVGALNICVKNGSLHHWGDSGVDLASATNTVLTNLTVRSNTNNGIHAGTGAVVSKCVSTANTTGFFSGSRSNLNECSSFDNSGDGFRIGNSSAISACTAAGNLGNGIVGGYLSTVQGCTSADNALDGINMASSNIVADCSVAQNGGDGIQITFNSIVSRNTCSFGGFNAADGAGIHVTASGSRIEGNHCVNCDRGIDVDGNSNVIIRNTCTSNTVNYDIVANNRYGPIIDLTTGTTAAVTGSAAASTLVSSDPNANYSR